MLYTIFHTLDKYYMYTRSDNQIIEIGSALYNTLARSSEVSDEFLSKYGVSVKSSLEKIEHPFTSLIEDYLSEQMSHIVFQVTQNCNLRCSYCSYTETSNYSNRKHSDRRMSVETAKAGVDFLLAHSTKCSSIHIGFYGGEPLLEMMLIKQIVSYANSVCKDKKIHFALTTNGTLLSDEIVDYLVENHFTITVSLDGPKEYHDLNRKFANGRGSYDVIIANLQRLKQRYPSYEFLVNSVLTPDKDIACMENFLTGNEFLYGISSRLSFLSDTGLDQNIIYDEFVLLAQRENELKLLLEAAGHKNFDETDLLFGDYVREISRVKEILDLGSMAHLRKGHPSGVCLPGATRAMLDVNGVFYPCEKVCEKAEARIGDLSGFYTENIKSLLNIARLTEEKCKDCWAFFFCNQCVAAIMDSKGISTDKRVAKCKNTIKSVTERLQCYMLLKENGVTFDKYY